MTLLTKSLFSTSLGSLHKLYYAEHKELCDKTNSEMSLCACLT